MPRDLLTAVLLDWSDLVRLRAVLAALHACLVSLRGDTGECDTLFATTRPLVAVTRTPPPVMTPPQALEALAADCLEDPRRLSRQRRAVLVAAVRATFVALFWLDGRVRRWVMAPDTACHAATLTCAPARARVQAWAAAGAASVAAQYAEDLFLVAAGYTTPENEESASASERVHTLTHDFVAFMQHWWLTGLATGTDAHARRLMDEAALAAHEGILEDEERRRQRLLEAAAAAAAKASPALPPEDVGSVAPPHE